VVALHNARRWNNTRCISINFWGRSGISISENHTGRVGGGSAPDLVKNRVGVKPTFVLFVFCLRIFLLIWKTKTLILTTWYEKNSNFKTWIIKLNWLPIRWQSSMAIDQESSEILWRNKNNNTGSITRALHTSVRGGLINEINHWYLHMQSSGSYLASSHEIQACSILPAEGTTVTTQRLAWHKLCCRDLWWAELRISVDKLRWFRRQYHH